MTTPAADLGRRAVSRRGFLGATLAAATLAACSRPAAPGAPVGAAVSATDLTGARIDLAAPARRVVTIPIPAASMVVAVNGGPDVLVGMNASAQQAIKGGYLGEAFPQLLSVPSDVAGEDFNPSVERILALEPDVVVQWGDRGTGLVAPLTGAGLQVAQLTYGTQEFLEGAATLYGNLLGKQDRSTQLVAWMQEQRKVREAAASAGRGRKVLYLSAVAQGVKVAGKGQYNDFTTRLVGGTNPAGELPGTPGVDVEQILAWNPEIVLLGNFDPTMPEQILSDPRWAAVEAVRAKRVYRVPLGGYRWDPPNQESPLMWEWLAGLVAEDRVPASLPESIRTNYQFLYGTRPTDAQIASILRVGPNKGTPGYAGLGT
ncbi:MAG: hypothetical protein ABS81_13610 [Pseudonocardia sp. SCN 72-86]|nr:MAG: hypothetical protein ABS81_13610 [Pseudonocardia sp. SCN 72-86]